MYKSDSDILVGDDNRMMKRKANKKMQNRLYLKAQGVLLDDSNRNNEVSVTKLTNYSSKMTILPGLTINSPRNYTSSANNSNTLNGSPNKTIPNSTRHKPPLNELLFNKKEIENFKQEKKRLSPSPKNSKKSMFAQAQNTPKISLQKVQTTRFFLSANMINNNPKQTHSYADPYKKFFKTQIEFQHKSMKEKLSYIYRKGICAEELEKFAMQFKMEQHDDVKQRLRIKEKNKIAAKGPKKSPPKQVDISQNYKPLEDFSKKLYLNHAVNLNNQVNVKFQDEFQLIKTDKFSDKFQFCKELADSEERLMKEKEKALRMKKLESEFTLKDEVNCEILKQRRELKQETLLEIRRRWKRMIMFSAMHFKKLNISLQEFYDKKYLNLKPYEKDGSKELIQAVKEGNSQYVRAMLQESKFLVHAFDYFNQTPLHWAAKRDQYHIIPLLLRFGAKIDSEDYSGRTALHIAAQSNNLESVKILLYELAYPFRKTHAGELAMDLTTNRLIKFYLERAKNLHIINRIDNARIMGERIRHGFKFFFDFGDNSILKELAMGGEK